MITLRTEQQSEEISVQHGVLIWAAVSYVNFQNGHFQILKSFSVFRFLLPFSIEGVRWLKLNVMPGSNPDSIYELYSSQLYSDMASQELCSVLWFFLLILLRFSLKRSPEVQATCELWNTPTDRLDSWREQSLSLVS